MASLIGVMKAKISITNSPVRAVIPTMAVEKTVSGLNRSSLAKRNSVVSIPKVSITRISAV